MRRAWGSSPASSCLSCKKRRMACWTSKRGVGPGCNTREIADKLIDLKAELADLEHQEHELDQQRIWVQQSIKNVTDDVQNTGLAYLTHEDICRCFRGDTLLAIKAPSGTCLEVPVPEGVKGQKKFQIHLKSSTGPIEVLLVNKDTSNSPPVVVPVPPPEDLVHPAPVVTGTPEASSPGPKEETESRTLTLTEPSSPAQPPVLDQDAEVLELPTDISEFFDSTKECITSDLLEELMSSEGEYIMLCRKQVPPPMFSNT
ncbi:hypothetical protein GDO81_015616 [Engystomops pustulosus]|uniref:E2F transcription factor CC-MB domain-containing protein n=1 Tax=Engystomops pustulosus TaxID=76066 RepID=A0AAV7ATT1_ENGPU|nr:hypothetical protein GDO81_015616 [Engystomops pustulosus]